MKKLGCAVILPLSIALTLPWVWFLWGVATWQGCVIGFWGLSATWLPAWLLGCLRKNPNTKEVVRSQPDEASSLVLGLKVLAWAVIPVVFVVSSIAVIWQTPSRQSSDGAAISNQYAPRQTEYSPPFRFSLSNIVPEKEQINLGFRLMPFVDPVLTAKQVNRISTSTFDLYDALESDPDFRDLGCVLGSGYADMGQREYDDGHYFLYVPKSLDTDKPKPAIVFLHGSGGNFKPYMWLWAKLAEKEGFVIIAPTFGFGNWNRTEGLEVVRSALEDAKSKANIASEQVYLAGLSNGGLGVSQVAAADARNYKGLIFLSPVFDTEQLETNGFVQGWRGRPNLVISGGRDKRISLKYVTQHVEWLKKSGVKTTFVPYQGQDHFLFFEKSDEVLEDIASWLRKCQRK